MKLSNIFLLALLCLLLCQCSDDDEPITQYRAVTVNFFTDHPDFYVSETVFETVSEEVLTRSAYDANDAVFDTIYESVWLKQGHKRYIITDTLDFDMSYNSGLIYETEITCYPKRDSIDIEIEEVPTVFEERFYLLAPDPDGADCARPARYETRFYQRRAYPASIRPRTDEPRSFHQQIVFVPLEMTLQDFFDQQGIHCNPSNYTLAD